MDTPFIPYIIGNFYISLILRKIESAMGLSQQGQKKILVVDDGVDLTLLCRLALEYNGFKVDTFTDPLKALSNYKPNYYDLVILDITMPRMDGFQLRN